MQNKKKEVVVVCIPKREMQKNKERERESANYKKSVRGRGGSRPSSSMEKPVYFCSLSL